jgi:hypothetical protein
MAYQLDSDGFPYPTAEVAETKETCINCHEPGYFNYTEANAWTHWHGGKWCRSRQSFSLSTHFIPAWHPEGAVL